MKDRILVVEDDSALARVLRDNLACEGFEVECVGEGRLALDRAMELRPDVVLLDVMLPDQSGFELCGELRRRHRCGVIMLTARSQKADRLEGLRAGADDYVIKPFDLEELLARTHAVLRRTRSRLERLPLGTVIVDFRSLQAWNFGRPLDLTHREFELLRYLAERSGTVVGRVELLREVWHCPETLITRSVDHAIARLRKKIEADVHKPKFIHTVHGDGYCLITDSRQV